MLLLLSHVASARGQHIVIRGNPKCKFICRVASISCPVTCFAPTRGQHIVIRGVVSLLLHVMLCRFCFMSCCFYLEPTYCHGRRSLRQVLYVISLLLCVMSLLLCHVVSTVSWHVASNVSRHHFYCCISCCFYCLTWLLMSHVMLLGPIMLSLRYSASL